MDVWTYRTPEPEIPVPFEIEVLFRDENLVVVDKPHFLATTPRAGHVTETALVRLRRDLGLDDLAPAHRLDRLTAGVLVLTTDPAHRGAYQDLFATRRVAKTYLAVAPAPEGTPEVRERSSRIVKTRGVLRAAEVDGEPDAHTRITLLDTRDDPASGGLRLGLYRLEPTTGRTHQLRVHMNALGTPILGDDLYPDVLEQVPGISPARSSCWRSRSFTDPSTADPPVRHPSHTGAVADPAAAAERARSGWKPGPSLIRPGRACCMLYDDHHVSREHMTTQAETHQHPGAADPVAAVATDLVMTYGEGETEVRALDHVSATFARGRFTAIMGPSGSGKSTLMHCMAGLDRPTSGSVRIGETEIVGLPDKQLTALRRDRIGFVFQSVNLVPTLTAEETSTLPQDIAGHRIDRAWFDEIVGRLGIGDRLAPALRTVRRAAAACRLCLRTRGRPDILFGDEPTGNLDSTSSAEVLSILRSAADDFGQTVVIVTHDPRAATYADRVLLLADGRLVRELVSPTADEILAAMGDLEEP